MRLSYLITIVLIIISKGMATTYFIDYENGSDLKSGTSKETAWKRSPGMAGFSGSYAHTPGDSIIFKGGVTWPSVALPFLIRYSGVSGNYDVYTVDLSWFTGASWSQPVFDGELFGKTLLSANGVHHVKIDNLCFKNAGSRNANSIIGFKFINCSYLELSHNTFAPQAWGCLYISAEKTGDYHDISIHHNDISQCAFGMRIVPAAPAAIMHNVQIFNNHLHDFHSQLSGSVHGDGIQYYCSPDVAASYDRYINGFKIFNNRFTGDFTQVAGSRGAMTALIYLSGASKGVEIVNNLFAPFTKGRQSPNFFEAFISLRDNPNRGGFHKIYNNTFVTQVPNGQAAALLEGGPRYPSPNLDVKNNIFSGFQWPLDMGLKNHVFDYNNIHFTRSVGKWGGAWVESFSAWQKIGNDIHGISADPKFVSSSHFQLQPGSPCEDRGISLGKSFAFDIDSTPRPQGNSVDIGAFETPKHAMETQIDVPHSGELLVPVKSSDSLRGTGFRSYELSGRQNQGTSGNSVPNSGIMIIVPKDGPATVVPNVKE